LNGRLLLSSIRHLHAVERPILPFHATPGRAESTRASESIHPDDFVIVAAAMPTN
jgi:hypothetical protein